MEQTTLTSSARLSDKIMFPDNAARLQERVNTENISGLEKQKQLLFIFLFYYITQPEVFSGSSVSLY